MPDEADQSPAPVAWIADVLREIIAFARPQQLGELADDLRAVLEAHGDELRRRDETMNCKTASADPLVATPDAR